MLTACFLHLCDSRKKEIEYFREIFERKKSECFDLNEAYSVTKLDRF